MTRNIFADDYTMVDRLNELIIKMEFENELLQMEHERCEEKLRSEILTLQTRILSMRARARS